MVRLDANRRRCDDGWASAAAYAPKREVAGGSVDPVDPTYDEVDARGRTSCA